jgi:hypothetical protein
VPDLYRLRRMAEREFPDLVHSTRAITLNYWGTRLSHDRQWPSSKMVARSAMEVLAGLRALAKKPDTPKGVRRAARKALEQSGT